jgi:hypothetical protein
LYRCINNREVYIHSAGSVALFVSNASNTRFIPTEKYLKMKYLPLSLTLAAASLLVNGATFEARQNGRNRNQNNNNTTNNNGGGGNVNIQDSLGE